MDTWKPKYFNKQDLPDRTTKKLPFSCAFLNKKEFAITIFVCMFQQKHLKCLDDFFFLITILEVGLITCFRERCYFTEIALVLSTVAS